MASDEKAPIWVRWCAKDALDGMVMLSPVEECAYRRILDSIFVTGDKLADDDRAMAWITKAGRQWKAVKKRLLDLGKITVESGFIRNKRASEACSESRSFVAQKVRAGNASAEARKLLKDIEPVATGVGTSAPTGVATGVPTNQQSQEEGESPSSTVSVPAAAASRRGPTTCRLDTNRQADWQRWADDWEPGRNPNATKEPVVRAPWQLFGADPNDPWVRSRVLDREYNLIALCRSVCRAAGLDDVSHEADWTPVCQWVHRGAARDEIVAGVERGATFAAERGIAIAGLGFFTKFITSAREERAA